MMLVSEDRIPDRGVMFIVYDMRAQGATLSRIAATVGRPEGTVASWLQHPERFDPYLDEVALERALEGDRKVFDNLTIYELEAFYDRLTERLKREPYDNKLYSSSETPGIRGTRSPFWMHNLARLLGFPADSIRRTVIRRAA